MIYSVNNDDNALKIYGLSQNQDTKDYILVLQDGYCKKCGKQYTNIKDKWCQLCQTDDLEIGFTNWTSGNEQIDELIREVRLKVSKSSDVIFEWIPYNQFDDIKKVGEGGFAKVYSAMWRQKILIAESEEHIQVFEEKKVKVALKCLFNSNYH